MTGNGQGRDRKVVAAGAAALEYGPGLEIVPEKSIRISGTVTRFLRGDRNAWLPISITWHRFH